MFEDREHKNTFGLTIYNVIFWENTELKRKVLDLKENIIVSHYESYKGSYLLNNTYIGCVTIFWKKYEIDTVMRSLKGTYYETSWYGH